MNSKFKKVFRCFFFIISAIVFLFFFFPERVLCKGDRRAEKITQKKRQSILKKRVYYTKEIDNEKLIDEEVVEE